MALKEIAKIRKVKLELVGAQAKPGPVLASLGINMPQFTKDFNAQTINKNGDIVPVLITIMPNKSFKFEIKTTPTAVLLKAAINVEKGSKVTSETIGIISMSKIEEIAKYKLIDSNANDLKAMQSMVIGTAKQMGIKVE